MQLGEDDDRGALGQPLVESAQHAPKVMLPSNDGHDARPAGDGTQALIRVRLGVGVEVGVGVRVGAG